MYPRWLIIFSLGLMATNARAELIINGDSLFDTQTGLRWSAVQIPTATFTLQSATLTIATTSQFLELVSHIGAPAMGPFSEQTQALAEWLSSSRAYWTYAGYSDFPTEICSGPNNGGDCYLGISASYRHYQYWLPEEEGEWILDAYPTLSTYGPDFSLNYEEWPEYVSAWAVQPVPLPAAAGLFLGGLALLSAIRKKRAPSQ